MLDEDDDILNEIEEVKENETSKVNPRPGDTDWEDFVLSKLTEKEVEGGHPSTAGLRRIAPGLLGRFIDSGPITTFNPQQSNDHRATIVYEIVYVNKYFIPEEDDENEKIIRIREVADAWENNIDGDIFKKFPSSIASTRAEGRALRKALLLSVAVKEELSTEDFVPVNAVSSDEDKPITSTQKTTIINICKRKKIDLDALIKWGKNDSMDELSKERAKDIIKWLNDDEKIAKAPKRIFIQEND